MNKTIDLSQPIPPEWRVRGADSHLYSIGLSLFQPKSYFKRKWLYNPYFGCFIIFSNLIKYIILFVINYKNIKFSQLFQELMCNIDHLLGTSIIFTTIFIMADIFC